jgi:hypothetical protein
VLILDSSTADVRALNRKTVSAARLDARILEFDESIWLLTKIKHGLSEVRCAEDDLVFVEPLLSAYCADVLAHAI